MLKGASSHYGDSIGLCPISMASPKVNQKTGSSDAYFWEKECSEHPYRIACLNYEAWTGN